MSQGVHHSLFFVGARYVCTKCSARGVTVRCACGAIAAAVDILDASNAGFLRELTSPAKPVGAPSRQELFWGGLKSPTQWLLSAGAAIFGVGAMVASNQLEWSGQKVAYAVAEVLLLTLLLRLPILAAALLFRLLLMSVELLIALACYVAGAIAGSESLRAAASSWVCRAERALSGEYFWRRTLVALRSPAYLRAAECFGALPPSMALRLLVTAGKHGALELRDAEVPPFRVVLSSGELVSVVVDAGVVSFREPRLLPSPEKARSPLFLETQQIEVPAAACVSLTGGEWSDNPEGSSYRDRLEPRTLRGTAARPIEVAFIDGADALPGDAPALTPGRPPRSSP